MTDSAVSSAKITAAARVARTLDLAALQAEADAYITTADGKRVAREEKREHAGAFLGAAFLALIGGGIWAWFASSVWPLFVAAVLAAGAIAGSIAAWMKAREITRRNENTSILAPEIVRELQARELEYEKATGKDQIRNNIIAYVVLIIGAAWCLQNHHHKIGEFATLLSYLAVISCFGAFSVFAFNSYNLAKLRALDGHNPFITEDGDYRAYRLGAELWRLRASIVAPISVLTGLAAWYLPDHLLGSTVPAREIAEFVVPVSALLFIVSTLVLWWTNSTLGKIGRDEAYRERDQSDASLRFGPIVEPVGQQPHGHAYDEGTI